MIVSLEYNLHRKKKRIFFPWKAINVLNTTQERKHESWNQWSHCLNIVLSVFSTACGQIPHPVIEITVSPSVYICVCVGVLCCLTSCCGGLQGYSNHLTPRHTNVLSLLTGASTVLNKLKVTGLCPKCLCILRSLNSTPLWPLRNWNPVMCLFVPPLAAGTPRWKSVDDCSGIKYTCPRSFTRTITNMRTNSNQRTTEVLMYSQCWYIAYSLWPCHSPQGSSKLSSAQHSRERGETIMNSRWWNPLN